MAIIAPRQMKFVEVLVGRVDIEHRGHRGHRGHSGDSELFFECQFQPLRDETDDSTNSAFSVTSVHSVVVVCPA